MSLLRPGFKLALIIVIIDLVRLVVGQPVISTHFTDKFISHDDHVVGIRSPFLGRVVFAVASMVMTCALAGMFATRIKLLRPASLQQLNPSRVLTLMIYPVGILFYFAAGLIMTGWDLGTKRLCYAGIEICLTFYVVSKVIVYLFLLERSVMINNKPHLKDPYYITGVAVITLGFGTIAVFAFIGPVANLSKVDGRCRIGLPSMALTALLSYDVFINVALLGIYLGLTNKIVKNLSWKAIGKVIYGAMPFRNYGPLPGQADMLQHMMAKSIIATLLVVIGTGANLGMLLALNGHEQAWLCLTICCLDVTWSVVLVHWLTSNPLLDHGDRPAALHADTPASPPRRRPGRTYRQMPVEQGPAFRVE